MSRHRIAIIASAMILLFGTSAALATRLSPAQSQVAPVGPPAPESLNLVPESITLLYSGDIAQAVMLHTLDKYAVQFEWRLVPGPIGSPNVAVKNETYAVSYCPTAFAIADSSVNDATTPLILWVAGRGARGDTIIERWEFNRSGANAPGARQVVDPTTGHTSYLWSLPKRMSVTELYRSNAIDKDTITWMIPLHGGPGDLLIQFWSTRDVYSIRIADGVLTKIASTQAGGSWIQMPALSETFMNYGSSERQGYGYIYSIGRKSFVPTPVQAIIFEDLDKDGKIDSASVLSSAQWMSGGWGVAGNYLRFFKP